MKPSLGLGFVFSFALALALSGCGGNGGDAASPAEGAASASGGQTPDSTESSASETPEVDETPLDVENPETPEGVVNAFFKTFFSGDDDGAFALLTSRAQEAKRNQFLAQESDTVRWRITKKMKPIRGRVLVLVDVEDYTDSGAIQMDELTFILTNDDYAWRIAGFSVGDLAINFEESLYESYVSDELIDAPQEKRSEETANTAVADPSIVR